MPITLAVVFEVEVVLVAANLVVSSSTPLGLAVKFSENTLPTDSSATVFLESMQTANLFKPMKNV